MRFRSRLRLPATVLAAAALTPVAVLPAFVSGLFFDATGMTVIAQLTVAALLAALVIWLVHKHAARPLHRLQRAMTEAANGDLAVRAAPAAIREIAAASEAFNRMAGRIEQSTDRLIYRAYHDPLTGLPNRALFLSGFNRALATHTRPNRVAVMFMDIDRFKYLNDTLGHGVGDQLLSVFSQRLVSAAGGHMVARLGGDEFTVLVQSTDAEATSLRIADQVMKSLESPFSVSGQEMFISSSIGIAVNRSDDRTTTDLLRKADIALYRAKAEGRSRAVMFVPELDAQPAERFDLDNALRRAVERGELMLHYQPIVDLRSGDVIGMEALLRWNHPHRGVLSPATFIAIAEESGEIVKIGQWVLEEACRRTVEFQRLRPSYPLVVSVNISAAEFRQKDLPARICRVLTETGLPARQLKIELTESFLIQDVAATLEMLAELRALGVGLAIDDFGTGYSSLSYLQRFPVETLKIDQSFIARLGMDETSGPLLKAIVAMGNALKMTVIAEGIENQWQWDYLREIGCRQGQGHLFTAPVDVAGFSRIAAARGPIATTRVRSIPRAG